jgi:hypothetical protein
MKDLFDLKEVAQENPPSHAARYFLLDADPIKAWLASPDTDLTEINASQDESVFQKAVVLNAIVLEDNGVHDESDDTGKCGGMRA